MADTVEVMEDTVADPMEGIAADSTEVEVITSDMQVTQRILLTAGMAQDPLEDSIPTPGIITDPRTMTRTYYRPIQSIPTLHPLRIPRRIQ
jgi:hypothetical protein